MVSLNPSDLDKQLSDTVNSFSDTLVRYTLDIVLFYKQITNKIGKTI